MTTLKNLVNKGVKVDMGIPYELWDEPSVEVSEMKKQVCVIGIIKGMRERNVILSNLFQKVVSQLTRSEGQLRMSGNSHF